MNPPPKEVAQKWHLRLTFMYVMSAWSLLGIVVYKVYHVNPDFKFFDPTRDPSMANRTAKNLNLNNPIVYRISSQGIKKERIIVPFEKDKPVVCIPLDSHGNAIQAEKEEIDN